MANEVISAKEACIVLGLKSRDHRTLESVTKITPEYRSNTGLLTFRFYSKAKILEWKLNREKAVALTANREASNASQSKPTAEMLNALTTVVCAVKEIKIDLSQLAEQVKHLRQTSEQSIRKLDCLIIEFGIKKTDPNGEPVKPEAS